MLKVLCNSLSAESGPHFELLKQAGFACDVVSRDVNLWDEDQLVSALDGYHAAIAGNEPYTASVLQRCPELRVICRTGVGFDAIDLIECDRRQVVVATTPGVNHHAVAEHTIALLMGVARGFPALDAAVRNCQWKRSAPPRVMGSTLGLVGLGRVGQATAVRALGLGMRVIAADEYPPASFLKEHPVNLVPIDHLLKESDYISLHAPTTATTRNMINSQSIELMKPTAVLINTARGQLVNEADLCAALASGRLRGAGLDVFEIEPLPASSPLLKLDNVLLSGHIAGLDAESHRDTFTMAADTIISLHTGHWPADRIQNLQNTSNWNWARSSS